MSELTVSSTNPSAAGTFTIEDSTGVQATVQASDLQAKFGQRTRIELNGVSSDVAIHASANTTTVAGMYNVCIGNRSIDDDSWFNELLY